ncbi:ADP-ribosylglycohydrolase family protein [Actinophytocola sp.]|uniref:ADP-ribosylglycohydrolase family protein n=1 Tax=Actinophytocola sp. TaxID=1872138 RepID=UPI002ED3DBAC
MRLKGKQLDRAVGALVGAAAGDALGVPYEAHSRPLPGPGEPAEMLGGGLGDYEPGQWSDDTEMACVIAQVAATGADLRDETALDEIAAGFLRWYAEASDIGIQTRRVLSGLVGSPKEGLAERMRTLAAELHARTGKTAGNGSLMRTAPVALAHLGDTDAIAEAARAVSALTHHDPQAGDACVLWCLAIDHAVRTGELDVRIGLDHVDPQWATLIEEAERAPDPARFVPNGWVVTALQGAWAAVTHAASVEEGLQAAVKGGGDTDTVAAIAGALLGARYGISAVPAKWRRGLHGWPGLWTRDLTRLAYVTAQGGSDEHGWPECEIMHYHGTVEPVAHPDDPGVLLGAAWALRPGIADAVISMCRLGTAQVPLSGVDPRDHVEVWLIDKPDANNNLPAVLSDTATLIEDLRAEGKTVLLHCAYAESRTPTVAAAYGARITGKDPIDTLDRIAAVLTTTNPKEELKNALRQLPKTG